MRVKTIVDEDFVNYRKPSMFIGTISCNGKCCTEAGIPLSVCQNDGWRSCAPVIISDRELCIRYLTNPLTNAIVIGGLEPFEQASEVYKLIWTLRNVFECKDDVVIYTGYTQDEVKAETDMLSRFDNIIIKFGRFVPNQTPHCDEVLGVKLVSNNQYAVKNS